MRYLYGLIFATSLCVVPSLSQAATSTSGQATVVAAAVTPPVSKQAQREGASTPAKGQAADEADDKARYAEREAESSQAQDYRGGDTVVIGASAATAILAVLLLIVLI